MGSFDSALFSLLIFLAAFAIADVDVSSRDITKYAIFLSRCVVDLTVFRGLALSQLSTNNCTN